MRATFIFRFHGVMFYCVLFYKYVFKNSGFLRHKDSSDNNISGSLWAFAVGVGVQPQGHFSKRWGPVTWTFDLEPTILLYRGLSQEADPWPM